jgi:hypothetical protein
MARAPTSSSPGSTLLPEVKAVLDADFSGQPVSDQNLSEWGKEMGVASQQLTMSLNLSPFF